jgi:hypothetical protein
MSYSLGIVNGDLGLTGSLITSVTGTTKLRQEIDIWLREVYQVDRFHPAYGSVLQNYIGSIITDRLAHDVEVEVNRVLSNLQKLHVKRLQDNPLKYTPDEILRNVTSVKSQALFDSIYVNVVFESASGIVQSTSVGVSV